MNVACYRTGRRVANTICRMVGDEPSDEDVFIGSVISGEEAARLVAAANSQAHNPASGNDEHAAVESAHGP